MWERESQARSQGTFDVEALSGSGFGAALRPQWVQGEAPGNQWILHIYRVVFYVENDPLFDFCLWFSLRDFTCKNTKDENKKQYDTISILLK